MKLSKNIQVVIPLFNGEKFLERTITSCLNQTHKVEVLIVDNCSTDNSFEIGQEFCKQYENLNIIQNSENLGRIGNWNKCLDLFQKTNFNFIKFLFVGDELEKNCIETLEKIISKSPDLATVSWPYIFRRQDDIELTEKICEKDKVFTKEELLEEGFFPGHYLGAIISVLLSKKSIENNRFDEAFIGIVPFYDRALVSGKSYYVPEYLSSFNLDAHMTYDYSLGHVTTLESGYTILKDLEINKNWINEHKYNAIQDRELMRHIINISAYVPLSLWLKIACIITFKRIKNLLKEIFSKS